MYLLIMAKYARHLIRKWKSSSISLKTQENTHTYHVRTHARTHTRTHTHTHTHIEMIILYSYSSLSHFAHINMFLFCFTNVQTRHIAQSFKSRYVSHLWCASQLGRLYNREGTHSKMFTYFVFNTTLNKFNSSCT